MADGIFVYISIPVISSLIGWSTNWIAIKMLFRPRKEVHFAGLRFIGLIPKRKSALADTIARVIERELISHHDLRKIIQSPQFQNQTNMLLETKFKAYLQQKINSSPLLTILVSPERTTKLVSIVMEELEKEMPDIMDSLFDTVEKKLDISAVIREKIERFDEKRLESIIFSIASRELRSIEILGGVIGLFIGMIQVGFMIAGGRLYG